MFQFGKKNHLPIFTTDTRSILFQIAFNTVQAWDD